VLTTHIEECGPQSLRTIVSAALSPVINKTQIDSIMAGFELGGEPIDAAAVIRVWQEGNLDLSFIVSAVLRGRCR
jgi:hypothetical protein